MLALAFLVVMSPFLLQGGSDSPTLRLADVFKDHAVLQRGRGVPVWGTAKPGAEITVAFAGAKKSVKASPDGKWMVELAPMPASKEGRTLRVESSTGATVQAEDILVGDVWICSGQSNMEFSVSQAQDAAKETAAANHPDIRYFNVPNRSTFKPLNTIANAKWTLCSPESVGKFSAVAYFFALELIKDDPDVPVGLVGTNWGGTPAESWTPIATLRARPDLYADQLRSRANKEAASTAKRPTKADMERYREALAKWNASTPGGVHKEPELKDGELEYAKPEFDCSKWKKMKLPGAWEIHGLHIDGVVWFRRSVVLPFDWEGKELLLSLGAIDDRDKTFWNGVKVGETGMETPRCWAAPRRYHVPGKLVIGGRNIFSVRVFDGAGGGGFTGSPKDLFVARADGVGGEIPIGGQWRFKVEVSFPEKPSDPTVKKQGSLSWLPGGLYDAMIHPLVPMAFEGVIWYQGESNAGDPVRAKQYAPLFMDMIGSWRKAWGRDFPFYFVQLANYKQPQKKPARMDPWAVLRDSQTMTLKLPNTGMAVIMDVGDAKTIHPLNKQEVGRRLALLARKHLRGRDIVAESPMFDSMKIDGNRIVVKFKNVGGGLKRPDGTDELEGFAIAGADRVFHWADAKIISKNEVELRSSEVRWPVAVRYAWHINPKGNLKGSSGLPACPFRTDDW